VSDIVTRLREFHPDVDDFPGDEAADRIVALEALRDRLVEAAEDYHRWGDHSSRRRLTDALRAAEADKEAHR
jgi:hypothetical protein